MAMPAVREIIQREQPLVGGCDETVRTAAARMAEQRCGSIIVCDHDQLCGIFTERDLLTRVVTRLPSGSGNSQRSSAARKVAVEHHRP